jgi:hypothetical protein
MVGLGGAQRPRPGKHHHVEGRIGTLRLQLRKSRWRDFDVIDDAGLGQILERLAGEGR